MSETTTNTSDTTTGAQSSTSETTTASTAAQQTNASTSTTADQSGSDQSPPTQQDAPWQDSLPDGLKTDPLFRTYKDVAALAQAHAHLTKLKGASAAELLKIPSKPQDQAPEDWAPIHKALGVPDDPAEYKIELASEAAADTPELANILRELGGRAKFQPGQMAAVIETLNTLGQQSAEAEAKALEVETKETAAALDKEWGAAAEGNRRAIGKLIRDSLGGQIDDAAAADLETKLGSNVTLSRVLAYAIGKMAEPGAPEGDAARTETRQLTPAAASSALNAFYADGEKVKALNDAKHPQHKAVLAERAGLLAMQRGEKRPDQPR